MLAGQYEELLCNVVPPCEEEMGKVLGDYCPYTTAESWSEVNCGHILVYSRHIGRGRAGIFMPANIFMHLMT